MVSNQSPSTSRENFISGDELFSIVNNDPDSLCILDCRTDGSSIKYANRVRLPNVLLRRLQQGSLSLSSVSNRLTDNTVKVVVIPGNGNDLSTSSALCNTLEKEGFSFTILSDDIERLKSRNSPLFSDEPAENSTALTDVRCLNLNQLRLAPETRRDKKQIFPVQILPHLYLGNAETSKNRETLESHGIHHIINVTSNLPNSFEDEPEFKYLRISVDDNSSHNLIQFFPQAISFIKEAAEAGDACLVHCLAGISRSVTICLAYLMSTRSCSLESAYDLVLNRNASIAPNFHFMGQLTDYESHLGIRPANGTSGAYPSMLHPPRSPSCAVEAAATSGLLTPPPTSCSASPQSSANSAKSFD